VVSSADADSTTAAEPAAEVELTDDQRRVVAENYQRGLTALQEGRDEDAVRHLELAWSIDPGYQQTRQVLKDEYLMQGMEAFATGDFERAVRYWEDALRVDPGDSRARGYLARVQEQRERMEQITRSR
jgi:Flp pilus assembly protein TadD